MCFLSHFRRLLWPHQEVDGGGRMGMGLVDGHRCPEDLSGGETSSA